MLHRKNIIRKKESRGKTERGYEHADNANLFQSNIMKRWKERKKRVRVKSRLIIFHIEVFSNSS